MKNWIEKPSLTIKHYVTGLIIMFVFLQGCTKSQFPLTRDNIITQPIKINMPATDGVVKKTRDKFVAEVIDDLDSYMIDDIGREKAIDVAEDLYNYKYNINVIGINEINDRIKDAINNAILDYGDSNSWLLVNGNNIRLAGC